MSFDATHPADDQSESTRRKWFDRSAFPWPPADDEVAAALVAALADGSWGRYHGPHGPRLEAALAEWFDLEHVALCCSGTLAVQLALIGLGVKAGDEVLLAGYDFPGNFRAIETLGARPVLVDVAPSNWNLDVDRLDNAVGERVRAVVVSHLHGGLVPMRALMAWAAERGVRVVEDICQAPGASVEGRLAGTWGDAAVLSFGGSKLLTAGRGGAVLSREPAVRQRIKIFCEQGNHAYPLSELQAAVLLPQLARLSERNERRAANVARLLKRLAATEGLRPIENQAADARAVYYKLGWRFDAERLGCSREEFLDMARAEGLPLDAGFRGFLHRGPRRCRQPMPLDEAARASTSAIVMHHPVLLAEAETIDELAQAIEKVVRRSSRNETVDDP